MKRNTIIICLLAVFLFVSVHATYAQDPYLGEIRMFAGNFAPRGWAFCEGQLLPISQNTALFSLLGTMYGGDGRTTFGLPDLRGRVPVGQGNGPGLTPRNIGAKGGLEKVTLNTNQIPSHTHTINVDVKQHASAADVDKNTAQGNTLANAEVYTSQAPTVEMQAGSVSATATAGLTGNNQSHENMPPFIGINFIISLVGVYPSRN